LGIDPSQGDGPSLVWVEAAHAAALGAGRNVDHVQSGLEWDVKEIQKSLDGFYARIRKRIARGGAEPSDSELAYEQRLVRKREKAQERIEIIQKYAKEPTPGKRPREPVAAPATPAAEEKGP
jgi:hypothetical protein